MRSKARWRQSPTALKKRTPGRFAHSPGERSPQLARSRALQARHIAEPADDAMTRLEGKMAARGRCREKDAHCISTALVSRCRLADACRASQPGSLSRPEQGDAPALAPQLQCPLPFLNARGKATTDRRNARIRCAPWPKPWPGAAFVATALKIVSSRRPQRRRSSRCRQCCCPYL